MNIQPQYIIFGVVAFVLIASIITLWAVALKQRWYDFFGPIVWTLVAGLASLVLIIVGYIPFNSYYYYNYDKTGVVEHVSSALVSDGDGGTSGQYAVKLSGHKDQFLMNDLRIRDDLGKKVTLQCGPAWVYNAQPQLWCSIVSVSD